MSRIRRSMSLKSSVICFFTVSCANADNESPSSAQTRTATFRSIVVLPSREREPSYGVNSREGNLSAAGLVAALDLRPGIPQLGGTVEHEALGGSVRIDAEVTQTFELEAVARFGLRQ